MLTQNASHLQRMFVEKEKFSTLIEETHRYMSKLEDGKRLIVVKKLLGITEIWRDDINSPRVVIVEDFSGGKFIIPENNTGHPKAVSCCFLVRKGHQISIQIKDGRVSSAFFI